jgi:hypothetical protein
VWVGQSRTEIRLDSDSITPGGSAFQLFIHGHHQPVRGTNHPQPSTPAQEHQALLLALGRTDGVMVGGGVAVMTVVGLAVMVPLLFQVVTPALPLPPSPKPRLPQTSTLNPPTSPPPNC